MYQLENRRYILFVLLLVSTFSFIDRQILAVLMQPVKNELQLSDTELGFLSGIAFAIFYSTLGIPIARWADRGNRVTIVSLSVGLWSLMTAFCGLAGNFLQLLLARIGVAVGEAGGTPSSQSLIADYFSRNERARAMSVYMMGLPLGIFFGFLIGGWVAELWGWRSAFLLLGLPGILLALLIKITVKEPERGAIDGLTEKKEILPLSEVLRILWHLKTYRFLVFASSLSAFVSYGVGQWLPSFFMRTHGMSSGELGTWLALVTGGAGAFGIWLGGYLTDVYGKKDQRLRLRIPAISIMLAVPFTFAALLWPEKEVALLLMVLPNILIFLNQGPTYAIIQSIVGVRMRAVAVAVTLLVSNFIGLGLGPQVVGIISDLYRPVAGSASLQYALLCAVSMYFVSAFGFWRAGHFVVQDLKLNQE